MITNKVRIDILNTPPRDELEFIIVYASRTRWSRDNDRYKSFVDLVFLLFSHHHLCSYPIQQSRTLIEYVATSFLDVLDHPMHRVRIVIQGGRRSAGIWVWVMVS